MALSLVRPARGAGAATTWAGAGFSAADTLAWQQAGFSLADAEQWRDRGYWDPQLAQQARDAEQQAADDSAPGFWGNLFSGFTTSLTTLSTQLLTPENVIQAAGGQWQTALSGTIAGQTLAAANAGELRNKIDAARQRALAARDRMVAAVNAARAAQAQFPEPAYTKAGAIITQLVGVYNGGVADQMKALQTHIDGFNAALNAGDLAVMKTAVLNAESIAGSVETAGASIEEMARSVQSGDFLRVIAQVNAATGLQQGAIGSGTGGIDLSFGGKIPGWVPIGIGALVLVAVLAMAGGKARR